MKQDVYDTGSIVDRAHAEGKSGSRPTDAEKQEMMKRTEAAGTPGAGHQALEHFVGNWKAEVKCWHEPGGPPDVSEGRATARWILNGRFLEEEFQGKAMGREFRGRSLIGYDNTKQAFDMVWVSDMQTSMFISEGRGENGNRVITLHGKTSCAATGRREVPMRTVLRVLDRDKHVFEMFDESRGANAKTMEITYTRQ